MIKKMMLAVLTGSMLMLSASSVLAADDITLKLNDLKLSSDVPPVIKSGRTLVPVRTVSTALGADVSWDDKSQKVTIIKNNDVIELTINKDVLTKNGQGSKIDVPAQIVNGRTMVPVAVIAEAFGAEVSWDNPSRTVGVTFTETKDGFTPEDLMLKSNEALQKEQTYKIAGNIAATIELEKNQSVDANIALEGAYNKTGDQQKTYVKEVISIPALLGTSQSGITIEIYTDGKAYWQKMEGQDWVKAELPLSIDQLTDFQDPQKIAEIAKQIGLQYVFGNDKEIDGKKYYTVMASFDQEKVKAFMHDILLKTLTEQLAEQSGNQTLSDTELDQINQIINSMDIIFNEKVYIDKETCLTSKIELDGRVAISAEGQNVLVTFLGDLDTYGFGEKVEMPDLK